MHQRWQRLLELAMPFVIWLVVLLWPLASCNSFAQKAAGCFLLFSVNPQEVGVAGEDKPWSSSTCENPVWHKRPRSLRSGSTEILITSALATRQNTLSFCLAIGWLASCIDSRLIQRCCLQSWLLSWSHFWFFFSTIFISSQLPRSPFILPGANLGGNESVCSCMKHDAAAAEVLTPWSVGIQHILEGLASCCYGLET